jgi:hypothetical protein
VEDPGSVVNGTGRWVIEEAGPSPGMGPDSTVIATVSESAISGTGTGTGTGRGLVRVGLWGLHGSTARQSGTRTRWIAEGVGPGAGMTMMRRTSQRRWRLGQAQAQAQMLSWKVQAVMVMVMVLARVGTATTSEGYA